MTLELVMYLLEFEELSKVFNLTFINFRGAFNSVQRDSVIAEVLAPVSRSAYVTRRLPLT